MSTFVRKNKQENFNALNTLGLDYEAGFVIVEVTSGLMLSSEKYKKSLCVIPIICKDICLFCTNSNFLFYPIGHLGENVSKFLHCLPKI